MMNPLLLSLTALLGGGVDMTLTPSVQNVPTGCPIEVQVGLSATGPALVGAVDVILSWNPSELTFVQAIPSSEDWFVAAFLNDPDGINDDVFDGEAIFTALINPANPLAVPPDALVVTFEFLALQDGQVSIQPAAGALGMTAVYGAAPGQIVTGTLPAAVDVVADDVPSLEIPRLGTPPNPNFFLPGVTSGPVINAVWDPFVDHSTFFPEALVDIMGITPSPAPLDIPTVFGTILCNIGEPILLYATPAGVPFSVPIPNICSVVGKSVCSQAATSDGLQSFALNALDLTFGTF